MEKGETVFGYVAWLILSSLAGVNRGRNKQSIFLISGKLEGGGSFWAAQPRRRRRRLPLHSHGC
jgi:hypothetical protein